MGGNSARVYLYRVRWNKENRRLLQSNEQCGKYKGNAEKDPNKLNRRSGSR